MAKRVEDLVMGWATSNLPYHQKRSSVVACTFPTSFTPNPGGQSSFFSLVPLQDPVELEQDWIWLRGGINSGKSTCGAAFICARAKQDPKARSLITANTYGQLETSTLIALVEFCRKHGIPLSPLHENNEETAKSIAQRRLCRIFNAPVLVLSAEVFLGKTAKSKEAGRGLQVRSIWADEYAYSEKSAFTTIAGRLGRGEGTLKGLGVITSSINKNDPYNYCYEIFDEPERSDELKRLYLSIHCPTMENVHADSGFIKSQTALLTDDLKRIEIDGEYVALTEGLVYKNFDRHSNGCTDTIQPGDVLHIGLDFNVGAMAAIVHVMRGKDQPRAVEEIIGLKDTPAMIAAIQERYKGHSVCIYPDASGANRKTVDASQSDIALLKNAGFKVIYNPSNPQVKDRVHSMNAAFLNSDGDRRYLINVKKCPTYVKALEKQVWTEKGEPDKSRGYDHPLDAAGYFIVKLLPIKSKWTYLRKDVQQES